MMYHDIFAPVPADIEIAFHWRRITLIIADAGHAINALPTQGEYLQ